MPYRRNNGSNSHTPAIEPENSVIASLESLETERLIQNQASMSMFQSEESEPESDNSSTPWSPPAWRKATSGWQQRHNMPPPGHSVSSSRRSSPENVDDTVIPARIPLPASPEKESPERESHPPRDTTESHNTPTATTRSPSAVVGYKQSERAKSPSTDQPSENFIRLAVRAEIQHRTEPIESAVNWIRSKVDAITKSPSQTMTYIFTIILALWMTRVMLFRSPDPLPAPDILKATQVARKFEPLIYYSEGGMREVSQLQDTEVAVWDLGESIRVANLTSGDQIVEQLDEIHHSLEVLVPELTRFFVNIDGDLDGILFAMQWAKRRLETIPVANAGSVGSAFDNVHGALSRVGILETTNGPTLLGRITRQIIGQTPMQRNLATLNAAFNEFMNVMEESVTNQLQQSIQLFALFERIDRGFHNLNRIVIREEGSQESAEVEMLSSLWTRVLGARASDIRKFERNKQLLGGLRNQTFQRKHAIKEHNNRLLQMKSTLDLMRREMSSQLIRANTSSAPSVDDQIRGLGDTWEMMKSVREQQKRKTLAMLHDPGVREISMGSR